MLPPLLRRRGPVRALPGSALRRAHVNIKREKNLRAFYLASILSRDVYSESMSDPDQSGGTWTLLTGHGHVLVEIARNPKARIRDISPVVGLTERTVQAIVADLEAAGYLTRTRTGRRVVYTVNRDSLFRHSAQEGLRVGPFLDLLADRDRARTRTRRRLRPGTGSRHAGGSAGVLPRTRRRSIHASRNLSFACTALRIACSATASVPRGHALPQPRHLGQLREIAQPLIGLQPYHQSQQMPGVLGPAARPIHLTVRRRERLRQLPPRTPPGKPRIRGPIDRRHP